MNIKELKTLVRDSISMIIPSLEVIFYHPNAPRIKGEYATVFVAQSLKKVGGLYRQYTDNGLDLDERIIKIFETTVSLNFFGENSLENAANISGSFAENRVVELFNLSKAGFVGASDIRDLTEIFDSAHEKRAQVDISIEFELTVSPVIVTGIETVKMKGTVENTSGVIDNVEISVP